MAKCSDPSCGALYRNGEFVGGHKPGCRYAKGLTYSVRPERTEPVESKEKLIIVAANYDPVAKPRMTQSDKWKKRPCVLRYRAFKDALSTAARIRGFDPNTQDVFKIHVTAYIAMPKSWTKKKKLELAGQPHRQKPDADNILKAVCDSLLKDDSRVWCKSIKKFWATAGGIDVCIYYKERTS